MIGKFVCIFIETVIYTYMAFYEYCRFGRFSGQHTFGFFSHDNMVHILKIYSGWSSGISFEIAENNGLVEFIYLCNATVGGTQIDTIYTSGIVHSYLSF